MGVPEVEKCISLVVPNYKNPEQELTSEQQEQSKKYIIELVCFIFFEILFSSFRFKLFINQK